MSYRSQPLKKKSVQPTSDSKPGGLKLVKNVNDKKEMTTLLEKIKTELETKETLREKAAIVLSNWVNNKK